MEKYTEWKKEIEKIISEVKGQVSVSFYDLDKNIAFSIDGDKKVLSASMIKLLILAELMRQVSEAKLSLSQKITLTDSMRVGGDGILKVLASGHQFSLKELAKLMIVVSDNEATNILIELLSMENINTLGRNLALKETFLQRKMMDSKAREKGYDNYTSSDDIALLLKLIYEGKLINKEASEIILDILSQQQQSERLQRYLPSDIKIAHKCGDLDNLENDGGIIWINDRAYILVVLTSAMPNLECRETIGKISKYIYNKMEEQI